MKVAKKSEPFIPYSCQSVDREDIAAVKKVLESKLITQGPVIEAFEKKVAEYTGARYAVAVSSGTAALHLSCLALNLEPGDEVITSPITFVASANCAVYCGARVRFADIDPQTWNLSPGEVKKQITDKTKAIIAVHFAGLPCELRELKKLADQRGIAIVEDAAHAFGAVYEGEKIGSCRWSEMATLSFHPVKHITTGEGGLILTNHKETSERLRRLRSHGITKEADELSSQEGPWYYEMQELGFNYRITDLQCALGLSQLTKLEEFIDRRAALAQKYREAFKEIKDFVELPSVGGDKTRHAWHLFVILLRLENLDCDRKAIFSELRERGIGVHVHYIPVHLQPFYRSRFGTQKGDFPVAENFYERALTLPLYPSMKNAQIERVIQALRDAVLGHAR